MAVSLAFDPLARGLSERCRANNRAPFEVHREQLLALISIYFLCHPRAQMLPTGTRIHVPALEHTVCSVIQDETLRTFHLQRVFVLILNHYNHPEHAE